MGQGQGAMMEEEWQGEAVEVEPVDSDEAAGQGHREQDPEEEEDEDGAGPSQQRRSEGGVRVVPAGAESDSSSSSSSEEEEEAEEGRRGNGRYNLRSRGGGSRSGRGGRIVASGRNALHQILALMVGRGEFRSDSDTSDSAESGDGAAEESEIDFWPLRRGRRPGVRRLRVDARMTQELDASDFSLLTRMRLQSQIPVCAGAPRCAIEVSKDCGGEDKVKVRPVSKSSCCSETAEKKERVKAAEVHEAETGLKELAVRPSAFEAASFPASTSSSRGIRRSVVLPAMLANREIGGFRRGRRGARGGCGGALSFGGRCLVMDSFLPNHRRQLARFGQKVFCGTYSRCGSVFMSACQDQNIRIYDTSDGNFGLMKTIRARNVGWSVLDTALSPDSAHLVYSSWCDYIHQVNVFGEEERHVALPLTPAEGPFCLFSLRFSSDGVEILGGANDGYLYLFDREARTESLKIPAHDDDVNAVAFADTTTHILASGGDDGVCKIWDRRSLRESDPAPVGVFAGHVDGITYIDPRGDGRHLITNSKDQSIKLWDLRKFSPTEAVAETRRAVNSQNWDYRWQGVPHYLTRRERRPRIEHDSSVMTYRGHTVLQTLIRCRFSPVHTTGQRYIYSGCASGAIVIYDALTGEMVKENKGHKTCVRDVSWHPYLPEMISSSWDFSHCRWQYVEERAQDDEEEGCKNKGSGEGGGGGGGGRGKKRPGDDDGPNEDRRRLLLNLL